MTFDQELAAKGKMRTQVAEHFQRPDGTVAVVMRQKIVKIPKDAPVAIKVAKPKITRQRAPKGQPTKQERVNAFVKDRVANRTLPITKEFRAVMVMEIMALVNMSKAGATTYMHNALKQI